MKNGLQVYTVGHLMPQNKLVNEGNWSFNTNGSNGSSSANASQPVGNFMYEPTAAPSETLGSLGEDGNEDDEDVETVPARMLSIGPPPTISSTTETPVPSPSSPYHCRQYLLLSKSYKTDERLLFQAVGPSHRA